MKILFVCMGNICRSPLALVAAEQAFREAGLMPPITIDSAGTLDHHAGRSADARSIALANEYRLDLGGHRARAVRREDFTQCELVVAMDEAMDAKEPMTPAMADAFVQQARDLLVASETGEGFAKHYDDALQRDPDVVLAHGAVAKLIGPRKSAS